MSEVLEALEKHTKAVNESLLGAQTKIVDLEKRLQHETSHREDLERKINKQRMHSKDADGIDHAAEFEKAVKSWHPGRNVGEYAEYRKAFNTYMRQGDRVLTAEEQKSLSVGVDPDGGYLTTNEFAREIIIAERVSSAIRGIARSFPIGHSSLDIPASLTNPSTGWVGEVDARGVTASGTFGAIRIEPGEVYCQPEATQKLLDDSEFDVEALLGNLVGEAFGIEEDLKFISGDGVIGPRGFTTYPTATTTDAAGTRPFGTVQYIGTGASGAWPTNDYDTYDLLVSVSTALRPRYRKNAVWVMGTESIAKLQKLKDANKLPLWQQSMQAGVPSTLLGYPVVEAEQMPAIAANSYSVAFGNFQRAYWIVDRFGVRTLRDPYTNKPYVRFYSTKRVGGGLVDSLALKLIKFI